MKPTNFLRVASPFRLDEYLKQASVAMARRPAKVSFDVLSPMQSHLLNVSLADHLPLRYHPVHFGRHLQSYNLLSKQLAADTGVPEGSPATPVVGPDLRCPQPRSLGGGQEGGRPPDDDNLAMPLGHHLVYFPPQTPGSRLAADGADPDHSPGPPFVRRLWAGGSVTFADGWEASLRLDGRRAVCHETVGMPPLTPASAGVTRPADKVLVQVVRRYGPVAQSDGSAVELVRNHPVVTEVRNLVFLREGDASAMAESASRPKRVVKSPYTAESSFSLVPDARLLFHFSALTFNAHAIHLDPQYAREREGHRGILVHGPLSLALMLSLLRAEVAAVGPGWRLRGVDYKNVAPLYAGEETRVCLRRSPPGDCNEGTKKWNVWVEGPDGGLAVKGTAIVVNSAAT